MTTPDAATEALAEAIAEANHWGSLFREQRAGVRDWRPAVLVLYRDQAEAVTQWLGRRGYVIRKARKSG